MPRHRTLSFTEVIDISTPLHEHTLVYPGDASFERDMTSRIDEDGNGSNATAFRMSAHLGTHIDAPSHFFPQGKNVHDISAERWISDALVIPTGDDRAIEPRHLEGHDIREGMSVLFRTVNCHALASGRRMEHPCTLSPAAADALAQRAVNLVGIDWLSIESDDDPAYPVHRTLLSRDIIILESIQLHHIEAGAYTLVIAPLHLMDCDGAPVRAMLLR